MGNFDFGFSLSENSVNEINSLIENYSQDIFSIMNSFQDELLNHVSAANYDKLLKAVEGIIELYNESVCGDLKNRIFEVWEEACESMRFFAQKMGMGEESEEVVSEIEDTLSRVFDVVIDNRLNEVRVDNKTSASVGDFDKIKDVFTSVVKKVSELSEDTLKEADRLGEENEFYKFILPVIAAYSQGVCSYFESAQRNIDDLEGSYLERMAILKDRVHESKKEVDLSSLLDFSTLAYAGMRSIEQSKIRNTAVDQQKSYQINREAQNETEQQGKYEDLIRALQAFNNSNCAYRNLKERYDKHLADYHLKLENELKVEYDKLDQELTKYHDQLELQLRNRHKELDARYIKGIITLQQAKIMYAESCSRADQLYFAKRDNCEYQYNLSIQQVKWKYSTEVNRCSNLARDIRNRREVQCRLIHNKKDELCNALTRTDSQKNAISQLRNYIELIKKECGYYCVPISNIEKLLNIQSIICAANQKNIDNYFETNDFSEEIDEIKKCQKMIDDYVCNNLNTFLTDEKKQLRMDSTIVFQDLKDFANDYNGKLDPKYVNGYYSSKTKISHVKNGGPHPSKTAIHEHMHALADAKYQDRQQDGSVLVRNGGVKVCRYEKGQDDKWVMIKESYRQVNEALTEYFCKKMMGNEYPTVTHVSYSTNMKKFEQMEKGFGIKLLEEAYFSNNPDLLRNKFDSVMGQGEWEKLAKAMDDSLNHGLNESEIKNAKAEVDRLSRIFAIKAGGNTKC